VARRRARREQRLDEVTDADGVSRGNIEADHTRTLTTVSGEVTVPRPAYRRREHTNPHPGRRRAESARGETLPRAA
jgi:hypothetical protein